MEETIDHEKCIKQPVETVATNVKYHSNQDKIGQFTVMSAFQIISQKDENVHDLVEIEVVDDLVEIEVVDDLKEDHERCTKQPVLIVAMNVKYHSNQKIPDQFTAMIASKIIKQTDDN